MSAVRTFEDLLVWKKSHELVLMVYRETDQYPKQEIFGLVSQTRRSAVSVSANIVEGFRRNRTRDSLNFYRISDASLEETKYHLMLAHDLHYISDESYRLLKQKSEEVGRLLNGWMKSQTFPSPQT